MEIIRKRLFKNSGRYIVKSVKNFFSVLAASYSLLWIGLLAVGSLRGNVLWLKVCTVLVCVEAARVVDVHCDDVISD